MSTQWATTNRKPKRQRLLNLAVMLAALVASALILFDGAHKPDVQTLRFSNPMSITNPYLPLATFHQDTLLGMEGMDTIRVERTLKPGNRTFAVGEQMVPTLIMEEREFVNGMLEEVTLDYFAQADDSTVYYLGEDVDDYQDGKVVGHSGAWLFGKQTRQPGMLMPGHPKVGDRFQAENVPKITKEDDEVLSVTDSVTVPAGTFYNCVRVKESQSDGGLEYKYYAPGIGVVKEVSGHAEITLRSHR